MASNDPQVPWTDEQWARVAQTVQNEAARSRVAASFLTLSGPLAPDADFIRSGLLTYTPKTAPPGDAQGSQVMSVDDRTTIPLATLQVQVQLRGAQVADPQLTSALEMFRRAANVLARLEDAIVFRGQLDPDQGPPPDSIKGLPAIWKVTSGGKTPGLYGLAHATHKPPTAGGAGPALVQEVSARIGELERRGHFGPFAAIMGEDLFLEAQTPTESMVLPSDRILPFLGGGPLLRSSTLPDDKGIVVALGASPVELVIATDVSVGFLQVTTEPKYVFRVYEKLALRIREADAIEGLSRKPPTK